ncbi:MAG: hypothetical protein ACRDJN_18400 [Chloroflexota bacterium]
MKPLPVRAQSALLVAPGQPLMLDIDGVPHIIHVFSAADLAKVQRDRTITIKVPSHLVGRGGLDRYVVLAFAPDAEATR